MAIAANGALTNFMALTGEKATTPACHKPSANEVDSDDEDSKFSFAVGPSGLPVMPRREALDIPQSISVVTPSPPQKEPDNNSQGWDLK